MILSKENQELFYKLWLPLLDFVNEKYRINSSFKIMSGAKSLNPAIVKSLADVLWEDVSLIEEYLSVHSGDFPDHHREIIQGWKRRIRGQFLLERHLSKGSIFISLEDNEVYQVSGIISSWEEMFKHRPLPAVLEATLMPFKEVIISDGLVVPYNISIGRNMKQDAKDIYMDARKNSLVHRKL